MTDEPLEVEEHEPYEGPDRRKQPWTYGEHESFERRVKRVIWLILAAVAIISVATIYTLDGACRASNDSREALRGLVRLEIEKLENTDPDVIEAFDLPPEKIDELIAEQRAVYKAALDELAPRNCLFD